MALQQLVEGGISGRAAVSFADVDDHFAGVPAQRVGGDRGVPHRPAKEQCPVRVDRRLRRHPLGDVRPRRPLGEPLVDALDVARRADVVGDHVDPRVTEQPGPVAAARADLHQRGASGQLGERRWGGHGVRVVAAERVAVSAPLLQWRLQPIHGEVGVEVGIALERAGCDQGREAGQVEAQRLRGRLRRRRRSRRGQRRSPAGEVLTAMTGSRSRPTTSPAAQRASRVRLGRRSFCSTRATW